jgi:hypothetical protein
MRTRSARSATPAEDHPQGGATTRPTRDGIVKGFEQNIPLAAQHKVPNVIVFGNVSRA